MENSRNLKIVELETHLSLLRRRERDAFAISQAMPASPEYRRLAQETLLEVRAEIAAIVEEIEGMR